MNKIKQKFTKTILGMGGMIFIFTLLQMRETVFEQKIDNQEEHAREEYSEGVVHTEDGEELHWWKYEGENKSTATIVLHGGPNGNTKWMREGYARDMAKMMGTVIFYDRRGCGESSWSISSKEDMTFEQAKNDLEKIKEATTNKSQSITLLGHSFGGTILVNIVEDLSFPVERVMLSSPFLDMDAEKKGRGQKNESCMQNVEPIEEEREEQFEEKNECVADVASGWNEQERYLQKSHFEALKNITIPTVMIIGECDILANEEVGKRAKDVLPSLQGITIPKGSHRAFFEALKKNDQNIIKLFE